MSEDRKIIEKEGLKYYKEKGQWYQISPIEEGKVPVDIKTQKLMKLNLLPEIQLDVFKCLSFTQLLVVQQTNVYFKNFVNEHGKVLAMKKFDKLEILPISDSTINRYQEHKPVPKLYDFELEEHRFCDFGMCEQKYKFFKPEPRLYEFELSEELEKKWKYGIKNSIPMFLTSLTPYVNTNIVVCELEQNDKLEKGLYYFQLSKYPKNIEEMKIARYFFQLLFNCSFTFFDIHLAIINPQMLELLFDDVKVPLQIHTQETDLMFYDDHPLNIVRNHLVANEFNIEFGKRFDFDVEEKADVVLEILANGGDKFSSIYLEYLHSKLYNLIIEHIVASQDITKMVKKIHFEGMYGPLISSENAINAKIEVIDNIKITKFQLVNKYNPKIVFSVSAKHYNKIHAPGQENCETGVDAKIRRIK